MKKNNIIILTIAIIPFFFSCAQQTKNSSINNISIDLSKESKVSLFDMFSKVEIIRLETNDSSIIKRIDKLLIANNDFYIFDYPMAQILSFNNDGSYNFSIKNIGQGPGQYIKLSDFDIYNDSLTLMSLMDQTMHMYDLQGHFARRIRLPDLQGNYRYIRYLNNDTIAFWTFDYENRLKFYSKSGNKIFKESIPLENNIYASFSTPVFPYGNYFVNAFDNRVMQMSSKGELTVAYEWDFGVLNNDVANFKKAPDANDANAQKELYEFARKIYASEVVNYFFGMAGGNTQYVYTQIMRKNKNMSIFYNKETKQNYVFEKTIEGASVFPVFWTEEYVIGIVPEIKEISMDDIIPDKILDENNRAIKMKISEFDNPILIKYYFKK